MASGWDFSGSSIPILDWGSEFLLWARSKNPEILGILGIRIEIWKFRKNPERKISKIPISQGSGSGFENPEKIPKISRVENSRNPKIPGIRDFFASRDFLFPGFGIVLSLGILITRVWDFSYFRDFFPGIFAKSPEFGIFYLRDI